MANNVDELVVKVGADIKDLEKGMDQTRKVTKETERKINSSTKNIEKNTRNSGKTISKTFKGAATSIASIEGPLSGASGRLSSLSTAFKALGDVNLRTAFLIGGTAVATVKLTQALANAALAADTHALNMGRLENIIKATGGAAGLSTEEFEAFAQTLARNTLASVEDVIKAEQKLATFTAVSGDTFKQTLVLAQDLAETGFGSLESNAVGLGKALQDPITGLTLLTKQGTLTRNQQKQIAEEFERTGDLAAAQGKILEAVAKQVGGAGAAGGSTLTGALDSLDQSLSNAQKSIGAWVLDATNATGIINELSLAVQNLVDTSSEVQARPIELLEKQAKEARKEFEKLKSEFEGGGKTGFLSTIFGDESELIEAKKRLDELESEIERRQSNQLEAEKKASEAREKQRQEAADSRLSAIVSGTQEELDAKARLYEQAQRNEFESELNAQARLFEKLQEQRQNRLESLKASQEAELMAQVENDALSQEQRKSAADLLISQLMEEAQARQEVLNQGLANDEITLSEALIRSNTIWADAERQKTDILKAATEERSKILAAEQMAQRLGQASTIAENLAMIANGNKKLIKISKAFALAQTGISIATGIARANELGFPANLGEIARVTALGAKLVSTIRGTEIGGGGSAPSASVGGDSGASVQQQAPQQAQQVNISVSGDESGLGVGFVRNLAEQLQDQINQGNVQFNVS